MFRFLCTMAMIFVLGTTAPASARLIALVIGNDSYVNVAPLQKARSDASGYEALLQQMGFDVTLRTDLDSRGMIFELSTFLDRIRPGDTVAFVFSGHGWSNGSENFLVPTDMRPSGSETLLERESFPLRNGVNGVLDEVAKRGAGLTLAIIDACRDNPFVTSEGTRSIGMARGLAPVKAPTGTFVAFSAGAGQTALDRLSDDDPEPYSVFTRHFLRELAKPQDLQSAFKQTQRLVNDEAARVGHPQRPAYYDEIIGTACLSGNCDSTVTPALVVPAPQPQQAIPTFVAPKRDLNSEAAEAWEDFKDSNSVAALELFVKQFEGTAYAALAQERINVLQTPAPEPPPAPQIVTPQPVAPQPVAPQVASPRPSWCNRAGTATEHAICADALLSQYDLQLGQTYRWWINNLQGWRRTQFIDQQKAWLRSRNSCGAHRNCLVQAYQSRLSAIQN